MSAAGTPRTLTAIGAAPRAAKRSIAVEQLAVAGGQLGAGLGNLVFSLVLARVLAPGAFADMATFLALYLVIHVPASSFSAGSALDPGLADRGARRVLRAGVGVAGAVALTAPITAGLLHVPLALMLAVAASAPTAGLIALARGRLYGLGRRRRAVASLLAEPVVRLGAGIALAAVAGPVGGAAAVVAAGWAALLVARTGREASPHAPDGRAGADAGSTARAGATGATAAAAGTTVAFLLLAIVQNQDLLLASALLPDAEAGRFAVLSTLGGVAAFATTTIPLMLLPRARGQESGALAAAITVASALGLGALLVVLAAPETIVTTVFGDRYAAVAPLAAPYVGAMALLGVARVLVAQACAAGRTRPALAALAGSAVVQAGLIVVLGHDARGVATGTFAGMVLLIAATAATVIPFPFPRRATAAAPRQRTRTARDPRIPAAIAVLSVGALVLRLAASHGFWLDEATTAIQARLPFGQMLEQLRTTDVHPPLHHTVEWLIVHAFGSSEAVVRTPSLVAGTLLVPLLYAAGRDLYDERAGVAAALFGAVAPFAIWYSQEGRMYGFFMVFALLAVWMQVRAVRDGRPLDWGLYTLASGLLIWNQYFGLFIVMVQQAAFLAWAVARRRDGRPLRPFLVAWGLSALALVAIVAPLVPFALDQFQANEAAGKGFHQATSQAGAGAAAQASGPSIYGAITNFVWALWGYHSDTTMTGVAALWPFAILLSLALLGRDRSPTTRLIVAAALVPAVALFGLGQLKPFVFEVRYFIGAVPLLLLWLGRVVTSWPASRTGALIASAALFLTFAVGSADQQLNGTNPRSYDFEGALTAVRQRAKPGDVVVYSPKDIKNIVDYYGEGVPSVPAGSRLPGRRPGRVFVVASFLSKPEVRTATARTVDRLRRHRSLVATFERTHVKVWELQ